jgi:LssY-like putative type I secretion system component LssY
LLLGESTAKITPMTAKMFDRRLVFAAAAAVAAYVVLAYLLAPFAWRHYEHQARLAGLGARTFTAQGIPGDVVNVGLEGTEADVVCAMTAAGWSPSDPVTLSSSLRIVGSVTFRRPYHRAPVSPLFFEGRRQDLAFEKPSGASASTRDHVRFWKALDSGDDGRPVWLGAATFDDGLGVSHYTGQITHHVAPDIDAERDFVLADLVQAQKAKATYWVSGVGPTLFGRNGGGDPFFTDGEIAFARLAPGCEAQERAPAALPPPLKTVAKNAVFRGLAGLRRWLPPYSY